MSQFVTLEEAKRIARELGAIGGGVPPYNPDDPEISGIYIPQYAGPFGTPEQGDKKFFQFRFRNGAEGVNVGLVKALMAYAPTRWPDMIALEVNAAAKPTD